MKRCTYTGNAYPTHPHGTKYMDRQDLPHDRTSEGTTWQREMHDKGWQFIRQEATPFSVVNPELEAIVAEAAGIVATEQAIDKELIAV